ncbi:11101_t:CDS:2, partial [Racocetra persica]
RFQISLSKFKISDEIKKRGSYKPQIKAKLNTYLLLTKDNKIKLKDLLDNSTPKIVEKEWDLSDKDQVVNRDQLFKENNLNLDPDDCISRSYREKEVVSGSRIPVARYLYVEYLKHSEQCVISQSQRDPPYRLLPYMKKSIENLLGLNVRTSDIIAQNARI